MPKISVVIPIYNMDKYLAECIQSILLSTFQDWELILVNDGSTDNSESICQLYVAQDARIKYISQKNQGVSVARNQGLAQALGKYVFFMDSDDTIEANFLSSSYEIAERRDADIVVIGSYFLSTDLNKIAALPTCAFMVKQSFLSKYPDVRFPVGLQPCEDGLFTHRLLALTNKLAANPDGIYNYRSHEEQNHIQINQSCTKILEQIPQWFKILDGFYKKYNLYQTKSLHLARFIEHEPIELRLLSMPFSYNQKKELSKIICTFMQKNVCHYLSKEEFNLLDWKLRYLIKNYNPSLLICIHLLRVKVEKIIFFALRRLINLIPIKNLRHHLREKYLR